MKQSSLPWMALTGPINRRRWTGEGRVRTSFVGSSKPCNKFSLKQLHILPMPSCIKCHVWLFASWCQYMRHIYGYLCNISALFLQKRKKLAWRFSTGRVKNTRYMSLWNCHIGKDKQGWKTWSWITLSYLCFGLPVYMTRMMRLITQSFVEVNSSICLMTVMPWQFIVK